MTRSTIILCDTPITIVDSISTFALTNPHSFIGAPFQGRSSDYQYYVSVPPFRIILVVRKGIDIRQISGWVYALGDLTWEGGSDKAPLEGLAAKRYRVVNIDRVLPEPPEGANPVRLSDILDRAPRSDRSGGWRGDFVGRPMLVEGDRTEAHSISLPSSMWRSIEILGAPEGRSGGVRDLFRFGQQNGIVGPLDANTASLLRLRPLEEWICDECGQEIEGAHRGYVEWFSELVDSSDGSFRREYGFRLIHDGGSSPRYPRSDCFYPKHQVPRNATTSTMDLLTFVGVNGIDYITSWMIQGRHIAWEEVGELMRRTQVPFYEEARSYLSEAREDGLTGDIIAQPDELLDLIQRYARR